MATDGDDDRRAAPRLRLRRGVTVTLRGTPHDTHTINVSAGGASVELVDPPERGARGSIRLELTAGEPINLATEVRWTTLLSTTGPAGGDSRHLVGLQFLSVSAEITARLTEALRAEEDDDELDA